MGRGEGEGEGEGAAGIGTVIVSSDVTPPTSFPPLVISRLSVPHEEQFRLSHSGVQIRSDHR